MQSLIGAANPGPNSWGGYYYNAALDANTAATTTILNVSGQGRLKQVAIGPQAATPASALGAYLDITIDGKASSIPLSVNGVSDWSPAIHAAALPGQSVIPSSSAHCWVLPLDFDFQATCVVAVRITVPNGSAQTMNVAAAYHLRQ